MSSSRSPLPVGILLALLAGAAGADAQLVPRAPVIPEVGEEVRVVRVGERGAVYGPFVEANREQVVLEAGTGLLRIPRTSISGMSVQRGFQSKATVGSFVGLGIGMIAGALLGQADGAGLGSAGAGAAVGAAAGLGAGFLIGYSRRTPIWNGVDMDRLRPTP